MKKASSLCLCIYLLLCVVAVNTSHADPPSGIRWQMVFEDEFDGDSLDDCKWSTAYPWGARTGATNGESEYYTDDAFEFTGGTLRIRAEKRDISGFHYTSGMIASYGKFSQKYGYFEMRAKLPQGKGFWPAFWLLPERKKWPPEIDIMENLGQEPQKIFMTNHYGKDNRQVQGVYVSPDPDFAEVFHTYGVLWRKNAIIWYVDGVERFRSGKGVPHEPMYILANLAVGGYWGGYPDGTTVFPGYMDIDYIRVYKRIR